ncbi:MULTISPECIES: hypothetical protein [Acinetobacter]|uniref:hypothetical protein n=1 Tax=Acinetobacter TaxID=469 RepID=UPI0004456F4C|nr:MULTISPECIES: hypothetical protein [Acinetobacter]EXC10558.1 hypothetical protein J533_3490 [Acinetobacter baumannii 4749]ANS22216.1 hypothetical protein G424_12955 [Acinetobacter baumannii PR07]KQE95546.1 hypothetical protein APB97_12905 [Acinetobacter baumannii]MBD0436802.1 hypothetical protein [Acinetobacter baumannii]MBD0494345.1 hypothetical protein [Acinetobacter baumannii]
MISWMKKTFIAVMSVVMLTSIWAKPASLKTMHALDDNELSKITDHDHSDKTSLSHTHSEKKEVLQNLTKENDLQNLKLVQSPQPK